MQIERRTKMADDDDDLGGPSIRQLIQSAEGITRAEIEAEVWDALSSKQQKKLGHAQLRRLIAAELTDPSQFEFTIDGEPLPLEDVPVEQLLRRGRRMVVAGKKLIERGQVYIAVANARHKPREGKAS
jgi:hypothetical protein